VHGLGRRPRARAGTGDAFARSLRARGLSGVRLVISDAHQGLKAAIATVFLGAAWQRRRVHFLRNVLARIPKGRAEMVLALIRTIWAQPDPVAIREQLDAVADKLAPGFPVVAAMLAEAREDVTAFAAFPFAHWKKIWSTNPLERVNKEIPVLDWCVPQGPRRRLVRWVTAPRPDSKEISGATIGWLPFV